MKKVPFYNPASPLFFHISVLLLYLLIFFLFLEVMGFSILIFTPVYPFFALIMATIVRRAYINIQQTPVPEQFANKLVLYNRYLISVIYAFSFIAGWFEATKTDTFLIYLFLLFISGPCFLFYLFILPIIIKLILLKKTSFMLEVVILGIFFLLFPLGLYFINLISNHYLIQRLYQILIFLNY